MKILEILNEAAHPNKSKELAPKRLQPHLRKRAPAGARPFFTQTRGGR